MKKFNFYVIASAVGLALGAPSMAAELSAADYAAAEKKIEVDYTSAKAACESLTGNASEICVVEADGKNAVWKADLEAKNDPTPELLFDAQIARAESAYAVAKERCDDTSGMEKTNCLQAAQTRQDTAKAKADDELKLATTTSQNSGTAYSSDNDTRASDTAKYNDTRATDTSNDTRATDTLFDFGSADLREEGRATLDDFVGKSKENSMAQISVIGYTDRLGTDAYNQQLSEQRTMVVKDYLVSEGIDASRISSEGKGDAQSTLRSDECEGERSAAVIACLQPDRRVVVSMSQVVSSN